MTARPTQGKREEIIRAALREYRRNAISGTTLKDVARAAEMPLGNLYYYVKTREELILAVLDECAHDLQALLDRLSPLDDRAWLAAYLDWLLEDPAEASQLGCPFGALATELRALGDPAADRAAEIIEHYRQAVAQRTQALTGGDPDRVFLVVQGAYTVAKVLNDPVLYQRGIGQLRALLHPTSSR